MAKTRKSPSRLRQERRRTTWTTFHLPEGQSWPQWPRDYTDTFIGPLADVAGCQRVRLGRKVEHPQHAAMIVCERVPRTLSHLKVVFLTCGTTVWESADALKDFQSSAKCRDFLTGLGGEDQSPQRLIGLQWGNGFSFGDEMAGDDLHGRITVTTLTMSNGGCPDHEVMRHALDTALGGFVPADCEDLRGPPMFRWDAMAWEDGGQEDALSGNNGKVAYYLFFRWNGNGASAEREQASASNPEAKESWANALTRAMPPFEAWEQERWDIQVAPCFLCSDDGVDEEEEDT